MMNRFKLISSRAALKFYSLLITIPFLLIISCKSSDNAKLLEEKDPLIKEIHEKDSIIIYKNDSLKNKKGK